MNPQDKKEESKENSEQQPQTANKEGKLQRKLRFKTLDGNIKNLECDYDIKISELKKKLAEIYNIEPNRQRLLNKGKQFKDDEYLDKLVDKDDTIIHLVFRSEEQVREAQQNSQNNNNTNQTQNQNNQNVNPFQSIINIVNSDQIRNLTNNIVNQIFSNQNSNNNNNNNNTNQNRNNVHTINIGNTQFQSLDMGEALNLANSPLHPIVQPPSITPPSLNINNNNSNTTENNTNNTNANIQNINNKNYSGQFPITPSVTDKKYDAHLKNIEKELNDADELMSKKIEPRIPLPLLNTTQNVFTAISRSLRKYVIVNQNILCHLMYLADIMEREQFLNNSDTRMTGNKLLDKAYKSLLHIGKASKDLSNVIKSSNFNTAPNTGYIGVVCQEVGYHSLNIPIDTGELNTQNILSALGGVNNNSNNSANSSGNNNSNNGNQGQATVTEINASIPLNIVEVTVEEGGTEGINVNINANNINNTNNNQSSNITPTNINTVDQNQNNNQEKEEKDKKDDKSKLNEKKEKEKEKEQEKKENINNETQKNNPNIDNNKNVANNDSNNNNTQNNTQNNKQNISQNITPNNTPNNAQNNNQNNTQNTSSNNNNFNNLFGNMMNQLMTPQNLNSIAGAVGSMLNNTGSNQDGSGGNSNPMGGLFGNLLSSLMGSLGDESDEEEEREEPPRQAPVTEEKKESETSKETPSTNNNNNTNTNNSSNNINLIKKLVDSPSLRRETKVNDESKIGEKMEPNIEFVPVSNDIISNLTIQEVFDMYNLHFRGLSRMRKEIQKKYFSDKSKNEETIKKIVELLCERFILIENQIDKLIPDKEFNIEEFFNKHLKEILNMFIDDNEINKFDSEWEDKIRKLVINMFISLKNEVKEIYETGEDGSKTFIEFNILTLIENFIGHKYLNLIQSYDRNIVTKFVENLFTIVKAEEIKNKYKNEKDDNDNNSNNNENVDRPNLLSVEEIFKIASKDKERLDKEEKEKSEENKKTKKLSDFYYTTSLFKS